MKSAPLSRPPAGPTGTLWRQQTLSRGPAVLGALEDIWHRPPTPQRANNIAAFEAPTEGSDLIINNYNLGQCQATGFTQLSHGILTKPHRRLGDGAHCADEGARARSASSEVSGGNLMLEGPTPVPGHPQYPPSAWPLSGSINTQVTTAPHDILELRSCTSCFAREPNPFTLWSSVGEAC